MIRIGLIALGSLLLVAAISYTNLQYYLDRPLDLPIDEVEYSLPQGGSLSAVAYDLARQGILSSPKKLIVYSRLSGRGTTIKSGDYLFERGMTPRMLLRKLENGDVRYFSVTLVEGWTVTQVLKALHAQPRLIQQLTLEQVLTPQFLTELSDYTSLEGLIYPDTYFYQSGASDVEILQRAYLRMQEVLTEEWLSKADNLPYKSPYEALIMASLVEKETGVASERGEIAGVFVRRLEKGMRLQTDPSIIYGLGAAFDGDLRRHHLKDADNSYNTYRHHGLTPTPIALAGREAIHAALHPEPGDSLYFVAKGDGSHYFSKTLEEHQRAVRKYQIEQRNKNYSSVPGKRTSG